MAAHGASSTRLVRDSLASWSRSVPSASAVRSPASRANRICSWKWPNVAAEWCRRGWGNGEQACPLQARQGGTGRRLWCGCWRWVVDDDLGVHYRDLGFDLGGRAAFDVSAGHEDSPDVRTASSDRRTATAVSPCRAPRPRRTRLRRSRCTSGRGWWTVRWPRRVQRPGRGGQGGRCSRVTHLTADLVASVTHVVTHRRDKISCWCVTVAHVTHAVVGCRVT